MKIFKNRNVIYFKKSEIFIDLIQKNDNIFKGKIILSDFQELKRICSINGIIHVLNLNPHHIPSEKIDCIVTDNTKNSDLEASIIKHNSAIPIIYMDLTKQQQQVWCGICNKVYTNSNEHPLSKYCSEKCMKKENGFSTEIGSIKAELIKDLDINNIVSKIIQNEKEKDEQLVLEFDKSFSDKRTVSNIKKTVDKFQSGMVKDAIRLEYAFKRESYKREMRQPSLRKASLSDKKERKTSINDMSVTRLCKGITKKGKKCTNRAIGSSDFCGILSHSFAVASFSGTVSSKGGDIGSDSGSSSGSDSE
jgi:hypothetical protein